MNRRGMTLIEVLVGMFLASLVTYIAFDLIRDEQGNYTRTRNKVKLQADAREGIRVIEEDLANIGFRRGLVTGTTATGIDSVTSPTHARLNACNNLSLEDRLSIIDDNALSSDTLVAQFFRPDPNDKLGVDCKANPFQIKYFVKGGNLIRQFWQAADAARKPFPLTSTTILENVVTFQLQAAVDTMLVPRNPLNVVGFNYPVLNGDDSINGWAYTGLSRGAKIKLTSHDSAFPLSGWSAATEKAASYTSVVSLSKQSTYQVSCMIRINPDFKNTFDGVGSYLRLSAMIGADTLASTNVTSPTIVGGPTWISWIFQTKDTEGPLKTVLRGQLASDPTGKTPVLDIGSFSVHRLEGFPDTDKKNRMLWQNGDTATAFRRQIEGIRVWLVAKSARANNEGDQQTFSGIGNWNQNGLKATDKNSYAVYERIIPVVHYGY